MQLEVIWTWIKNRSFHPIAQIGEGSTLMRPLSYNQEQVFQNNFSQYCSTYSFGTRNTSVSHHEAHLCHLCLDARLCATEQSVKPLCLLLGAEEAALMPVWAIASWCCSPMLHPPRQTLIDPLVAVLVAAAVALSPMTPLWTSSAPVAWYDSLSQNLRIYQWRRISQATWELAAPRSCGAYHHSYLQRHIIVCHVLTTPVPQAYHLQCWLSLCWVVLQIVLDQFVLKLIQICYIQICYIQFCVKLTRNTNCSKPICT